MEIWVRVRVGFGVPQRSVLGPLLLIIYILPLGNILYNFWICFHCYADDTHIFSSIKHLLSHTTLSNCLTAIYFGSVWAKKQICGVMYCVPELTQVGVVIHSVVEKMYGQNKLQSGGKLMRWKKISNFVYNWIDIEFLCKHLYLWLKNIFLLTLSATVQCWLPVQRYLHPSPGSDTADRHLQKIIEW